MRGEAYVGIDNGVSGTVGIILFPPEGGRVVHFEATPVYKEQSYTKKKQNVTHIHTDRLQAMLAAVIDDAGVPQASVMVMIERPMVALVVNRGSFKGNRFSASMSASRADEATMIVIKSLGYSRCYVDSREWQKALLPNGLNGSNETKAASMSIGRRMFPQWVGMIDKHKDADGLLIAEYCRLKYGRKESA